MILINKVTDLNVEQYWQWWQLKKKFITYLAVLQAAEIHLALPVALKYLHPSVARADCAKRARPLLHLTVYVCPPVTCFVRLVPWTL